MKYVISSILLLWFFTPTLLSADISNSSYREKILRQAAKQNGYSLPEKINRPFDEKKSALGKLFFESTELSFNSNTSCSSCHLDEFSSADGLPIAVGVGGHGKGLERLKGGGAIVPRNTLPLWGRASVDFKTFFWDGKVEVVNDEIVSQFGNQITSAEPLAAAVSLPFLEIREMVSDDAFVQNNLMTETISSAHVIQEKLLQRIERRLKKANELAQINKISVKELSFNHVADSLTHFFSDKFRVGNSKFAKFMRGDINLNETETNGGIIFYGKGQCASCHKGPHFSDFEFHSIVMPQFGFGKNGFGVDYGRFNSTFDSEDLYKFRTPPLHNVEKTAPYGHSGSIQNLEDVIVAHYDPLKYIKPAEMSISERKEFFDRLRRVGSSSIIPAALSKDELENLVLFLKTLSF